MDRAEGFQWLVVRVEGESPAPEINREVVARPCRPGEFEEIRAVVLLVGLETSAGISDDFLLSVVHL